jgi:hypothetical protein
VVIGYRVSILKETISAYERLGPVHYMEKPPITVGYPTRKDEEYLQGVLLTKANYWKYESEWRLILELKNTVGKGTNDKTGYPINTFPIPNEAVTKVYITERTPKCIRKILETRLGNPSNRFKAVAPQKLVLASSFYGYET